MADRHAPTEDDADPLETLSEAATGVLVFLILGAGFVAMFLGVEWFWMIWVLGFAVLLPMFAVLGEAMLDLGLFERWRSGAEERDPTEDALATLRERYARGEIDEAEFERRLERLLETETVEASRERIEHERIRAEREVERTRE